MRLVTPPAPRRQPKKRKTARYTWAAVFFVVLAMVNIVRPLPRATVQLSVPPNQPAGQLQLAWPSGGQAAIAAENYDVLATTGLNASLATASIAKVITALCVLEKYPLALGQKGPTLTMNAHDVSMYQDQVSHNGSRLAVYEGLKLTQYEAIQAIMIPSANNIADSLAIWAFGSLSAYADYANAYVLRNGLVHTHIGSDASGYDPSTTSTAEDLARLGLIARQQPVLMEIAAQTSAVLPGTGKVENYNTALGSNGITGLKTGNNDQNPGALLFTADVLIAGKTVKATGAVMGASSLAEAIEASEQLVKSIDQNFTDITYLRAGQKVGSIRTAWGQSTTVRTRSIMQILRWNGDAVSHHATVHAVVPTKKTEVGALSVRAGEVQTSSALEVTEPVPAPSLWWRLTRLW
ncbi:MAG: hypothetical protein WAQ24_05005 [Candidatus Saccharimonadales bacterium]